MDPWLRRTYTQADLLIGVAPYVENLLQHLSLKRYAFIPEMGFDHLPKRQSRSEAGPRRLIFVGRNVRTKGLVDALKALATVRAQGLDSWEFTAIGIGPKVRQYEEIARSLDIADRCKFVARLPRETVQKEFSEHDIFLFPSFREPSGNVVMEALSHGLPAIVADNGGPGFQVDTTCGIKLIPTKPDEFQRMLAEAIGNLLRSPQMLAEMGSAASVRAREIGLWANKIDWLRERYSELLSARKGS
jgi:glycosyltransferase involved in cell wall biosynthesis